MKLSLLWKYYWPAVKQYPWLSTWAFLGMMLGAFVNSAWIPLATRKIFDLLEIGIEHITYDQLMQAFILYASGFLLLFIFYRTGDYALSYVQPKLLRILQDQSLARMMKNSYGYFSSNFSGSMVAQSKRFVDSFETLHDQFSYKIGTDVVHLITIFIILMFLNTTLGFVFLSWLIPYIVITIFMLKKKMKLDIRASAQESVTTGVWSDIFTNILNVKMFASVDREKKNFSNVTQTEMNTNTASWVFNAHMNVVQGGLIIVFQILIFGSSIYLWTQGEVSLGVITIAYLYANRIFDIVFNLGSNIKQIITALANAKEMIEIFEQTPDVLDTDNPEPVQITKGHVSFTDVNFAYDNNIPVFSGLNLDIQSGEKVAFVGHSGAGKTTVTKLLLRFTDIQSGAITIDGQNIANITQDDLRRHIAYVPQDPILFHRTLRENIAYGKDDATEEEIVQASRDAHAHEFISKLPDGYETLVGERGIKLSGGERQRVAIARAMLKDAPLLVLDEATSALDSITEQKIQDAFKTLSQNRTTLVIAHRLSTIVAMDRIIVMENGAVAEQGTHAELLQQNGIYAELWKSQSDGFIGE